ncbi:MAG: WD40 repeat domain-containing protein, partial [Phototrophicaceae bacterium]
GLLDTVRRVIPTPDAQVVLFIDQFEELFTLVEAEPERTLFLESLHTAATGSDSPLRIIITLRADFYDRPLIYPGFSSLMQANTEVVIPLTPGELEDAIIGPAQRVGLQLEHGLVPAIVADVSQQPGALPLLQYALTELFEQRVGNTLTLAAYHEIGGVSGALARRAQSLYEGLDDLSKSATRQLFLQIASTHNGIEDTRRRVTQHNLLEGARNRDVMMRVITLFGQYRLLAFDREPTTRTPTVEIAHEALIRQWGQLREWLETNRDEIRAYRQLATATRDWVRAGRDPSFLATGARLGQFSALADSDTIALSPDESDYLQASIELRQRAITRLRLFVALLAVGLLIVSGLAVIALDRQQQARAAEAVAIAERDRADQQARISRSRELAVNAMTSSTPDLALLLSLEALRAAETFEARSSLLNALRNEPRLFTYLQGLRGGGRTLAFDPGGEIVAAAGQDATIHLWHVETRQPHLEPLAGHEDWINKLAFDPNGDYLASASADGSVRRWDVATGDLIDIPLMTDAAMWGVAIKADGSEIAASDANGVISRWDAAAGEPIVPALNSHEGIVYSIAFSPDGRFLASGGDDLAVRLWALDTDQPTSQITAVHDNWVLSVAFSPDGNLLASGGADNTIIIWDMSANRVVQRINGGRTQWIRHLAFDATGDILAAADAGGTVRLWETRTGSELALPLRGHQSAVWSAAFSPAESMLATIDDAGVVILWDLARSHALDSPIGRHETSVYAVAYSPDGDTILSGGGDPASSDPDYNSVRLWSVTNPTDMPLMSLGGHAGPVTGIVVSPDGQRIASSGAEGSIILWDAASGTREQTLIGGRGGINAVSFSPDGNRIAGAGDDGTVTIWPVSGGESQVLQAGEDRLYSLDHSPDGRLLVAGDATGRLTIWDLSSGGQQLDGQPHMHDNVVTTVQFSPDGTLLASGSRDGTLILWDTTIWEPIRGRLVSHTNWVLSAAFSPDGSLLASGSRDGTLILWDVASGRLLGQPMVVADGDWVHSVAFSPTDGRLVSGSRDGQVVEWNTDPHSWQQRACQIANRALTRDEWSLYMGEAPHRATCSN